MGAEDNVKTIQSIYEAFGRGDLPVILEALTEDVDWAADTSSQVAPWYGVRRGKGQVERFFQDFGSTMEVEEFTPRAFAANDSEVHTIVGFRGRARNTGRPIEMNLHHYFVFSGPRISYYRGSEDTAQTEGALRA